MAPGVQQSGNGATLTFEDGANGEAGGDGYTPDDLVTQVVAKGFKAADGVTPTIEKKAGAASTYLCHNTVQNGDGSGTAATAFKMLNGEIMAFDAGKGYDVSTVGLTGRSLEMGSRLAVAGADPIGYGGGAMILGKTTTLRGIVKVRGARLVTKGSNIALQILPGFIGSGSEILDSYLEATGNMGLGSGTGEVDAFNNTLVGLGGTTAAVITQVNVRNGRGNNMYGITVGRIITANSAMKLRGVTFAGAPTGTDQRAIRIVQAGVVFVDATYPRGFTTFTDDSAGIEDWLSFWIQATFGVNADPVEGIAVEVSDRFGATLIDVDTDAMGTISFGALDPTTEGALKVRLTALGVETRFDPIRIRMNHKRAIDARFPAKDFEIGWPSEQIHTDGTRQFYPVRMVVPMEVPVATAPLVGAFGTAAIQTMIRRAGGQQVSVAGVVTMGLFERRTIGVVVGGAPLLASEDHVTIETGSLPAAAIGVLLDTGGETYYIAEMKAVGDGALTDVTLAVD